MLDAERYKPFGLTLAQTYCYLDGFVGRPLSDEKLALLDRSLTLNQPGLDEHRRGHGCLRVPAPGRYLHAPLIKNKDERP